MIICQIAKKCNQGFIIGYNLNKPSKCYAKVAKILSNLITREEATSQMQVYQGAVVSSTFREKHCQS